MNNRTPQEVVAIEIERLSDGAPVCATIVEGVVTLTGAVPDDMRRLFIEQELLRLPEVLDVRNHLHVAAPVGGIRTQLLALLERQEVPTRGLEIVEESGAVVLTGQAASWFDRDAVERLAWTLPGVRSVENRLTLPPNAVEPDVDDAGNPLA